MNFDELFGVYDIQIKLEDKTLEERKDILFKYFLNNSDVGIFLINKFKEYSNGLYRLYFKANSISNIRESFLNRKNIIEDLFNISKHYKEILENTKNIANELGFKNSLELCILYTYLLWNGYFSKDRELKYQIKGANRIAGMYSYDIMNGSGVCLNFSDMLTDFINMFDYSAATLASQLNDYERSYEIKINRTLGDFKEPFISKLLNKTVKGVNHSFNLINEDNKLYIYDATNLFIAKLKNTKEAIIIPGLGKFNINPYFSYSLNLNQKSKEVLDLLLENEILDSPYNEQDFIAISNKCIELLNSNKSLLNDFYNEIVNNILNIVKTINNPENIKKIKHIKRH